MIVLYLLWQKHVMHAAPCIPSQGTEGDVSLLTHVATYRCGAPFSATREAWLYMLLMYCNVCEWLECLKLEVLRLAKVAKVGMWVSVRSHYTNQAAQYIKLVGDSCKFCSNKL